MKAIPPPAGSLVVLFEEHLAGEKPRYPWNVWPVLFGVVFSSHHLGGATWPRGFVRDKHKIPTGYAPPSVRKRVMSNTDGGERSGEGPRFRVSHRGRGHRPGGLHRDVPTRLTALSCGNHCDISNFWLPFFAVFLNAFRGHLHFIIFFRQHTVGALF